MARLTAVAALLLTALSSRANAARNNTHTAKAIIIDTDMMTDCDDAGALAIANVINTYFGNGHVPIGAIKPLTNETFFDKRSWTLSDYASKVAHNFPRHLKTAAATPDPIDLYHDILSNAANHSITIISVGFLTNLARLLSLPNSPTLLAQKVHELVIMGGSYPSGWEYNFGGADPAATTSVLSSWPPSIPITYSGYQLGKAIVSGAQLAAHAPDDSPVLAAYQWYLGRCRTTRESWDPLTVLYGTLGLDGFAHLGVQSPFAYANADGYNSITAANGSNAWVNDTRVTNQHWLELADGVTTGSVAGMLTQLYAHDPMDQACF